MVKPYAISLAINNNRKEHENLLGEDGDDKASKQMKPHQSDDVFYFGVQQPLHAMGLLCERIQVEAGANSKDNAGLALTTQLTRIRHAKALVCETSDIATSSELSMMIGCAWGLSIPTIVLQQAEDTPGLAEDHQHHSTILTQPLFDSIEYRSIHHLSKAFGEWLQARI